MAPRMVYVAYPIDLVKHPDDLRTLLATLENAKGALMDGGVSIVYDPGDAFMVSTQADPGPEVAEVNGMALAYADAVMALLPSIAPSVGVPMEISQAASEGKRVAVMTDVRSWTLQFPMSNVQTFTLDEGGWATALAWLLIYDGQPEPASEPLPYVLTESGKADCGKVGWHESHDFGEYMDEWCGGGVDLTPFRLHEGDAGWDLKVARKIVIEPGERVDVPMGIAVQLPEWSFGRITGRSSTLRKRGLLVNEGIIDAGYRGELFALVQNMTNATVVLNRGERVAQLILHENHAGKMLPMQVEDLLGSTRGEDGFGSTGS